MKIISSLSRELKNVVLKGEGGENERSRAKKVQFFWSIYYLHNIPKQFFELPKGLYTSAIDKLSLALTFLTWSHTSGNCGFFKQIWFFYLLKFVLFSGLSIIPDDNLCSFRSRVHLYYEMKNSMAIITCKIAFRQVHIFLHP